MGDTMGEGADRICGHILTVLFSPLTEQYQSFA